MPLAKQQDANTSIQIPTTPYTFALTQTLTQNNLISVCHAAELEYTAFISVMNKSLSLGHIWSETSLDPYSTVPPFCLFD